MAASIQGRGALIAYRGGGPVVAASENAAKLFGCDPIGRAPGEVLGKEGRHAVRNSAALPLASTRSVFSGRVGRIDLYAYVDAGFTVVEAEVATTDSLPDAYTIERDVALIAGARDAETRANLIRTLSGFDVTEESEVERIAAEIIAEPGVYALDDVSRAAVSLHGDVPPLSKAWLRLPCETALNELTDAGIGAVTVLRTQRQTMVLTIDRPRMPSHRTRLVLLHLAQLL